MDKPFIHNGIVFGGPKMSIDDGYLTLLDFKIPVVLNASQVFIATKPLYIPMSNFNIPMFRSQLELEDWMAGDGRFSLLPHLLDFASAYASSVEAKVEAKLNLSQIFGF